MGGSGDFDPTFFDGIRESAVEALASCEWDCSVGGAVADESGDFKVGGDFGGADGGGGEAGFLLVEGVGGFEPEIAKSLAGS